MKQTLLISILLCPFFGGMAQTRDSLVWETLAPNQLSLSLEVVKPNGKLDRNAYFLARLKNLNDSLTMIFGSVHWNLHTHMEAHCQEAGGEEYCGNPRTFFDFDARRIVMINPSGEYVARFPLFTSPFMDEGNGLLPPSRNAVRNIRRGCLKITKLKYLPILMPMSLEHIFDMQTVNLQSNWVEIDGEAFAELMVLSY